MVGNKAQKAVAAALAGVLAMGTAAPAFAGVKINEKWYRLNGDYATTFDHDGVKTGATIAGSGTVKGVNRYDTMLDAVVYNIEWNEWGPKYVYGVSASGYTADGMLDNVTDVVLVSGTSYADSLTASSLAGVFGSPIITTPGDKLGEQAEKAIKYFAEENSNKLTVWIVGGTAAVSDDVAKAIEDFDKNLAGDDFDDYDITVLRRAGADRTETSLKVAQTINKQIKVAADTKDTIFVANGWAWADALSVSSFSYVMDAPLFLTGSDGHLTADQMAYIADKLDEGVKVHVIGGPAEEAYADLLELGQKKGQLTWIKGVDRFDTSAEVVKTLVADGYAYAAAPGQLKYRSVAVATGENWPDALVGGAFVGARDGILVLAGDEDKNPDTWDAALSELEDLKKDGKIQLDGYNFILGGEAAISKPMEKEITHFLV